MLIFLSLQSSTVLTQNVTEISSIYFNNNNKKKNYLIDNLMVCLEFLVIAHGGQKGNHNMCN